MSTQITPGGGELTPDTIIDRLHRQLDADREDGLVAPCDPSLEDRIVTTSVRDLWEQSRVKTYVPILALRRARDEIQARTGRH